MSDNAPHSSTPLSPTAETTAVPAPDMTGPSHTRTRPSNKVASPPPIPITKKGQKYISPAGRHSQQSHRRAQENAAASGSTTEREDYVHERSEYLEAINKRVEMKEKQQREQKDRNQTPKTSAPKEAL